VPPAVGERAAALLIAAIVAACTSAPTGSSGARPSLRVSPETLSVPAAPSVFVDGARGLTAEATDADGAPLTDVRPRWWSSDTAVARVTADGVVTGRAPGRATVWADVRGARASTAVVVTAPESSGLTVIAHRGFRLVFPENTIPAIVGAFDRSAHGVEIDLRLTGDGVPVVMHDATVDRTTNGSGAVAAMTAAQITALDACSKFGAGWAPCPVPTAAEALAAARGRGFLVLHIYGPFPREALASLLDEVRAADMARHVVAISFEYPVLRDLRSLDPVLPLGLLTTSFTWLPDVVALGRAAALPNLSALRAAPDSARQFVAAAGALRVDLATWATMSDAEVQAAVALGLRQVISDLPVDAATILP